MGNCSSTEFDLNELFLNFRLIISKANSKKMCPTTFQVNFEHGEYNFDFVATNLVATDGTADNDKVHSAERKGNCLSSILRLILYTI